MSKVEDMKQVDFKHFIRLIGRGQRAGRTLTIEEACQAMSMLIEGQATDLQQGAFLMLLRVREETPEELAGFTQAFRQHTQSGVKGLEVDLDMGCYAGKRRHLPWFLLAALTLAQQGKRIFLHGTHEPDSNRLYLSEVLPALGLSVAHTAEQAAAQLQQFGLSYMDLKDFNPALDGIIQLRAQFGLRSCANTLARMLNPSDAANSLQGVFHRHVDEKHRQTAALLNDPNVLCFRGEGGEVEFNPERDVSLHIARAGQQSCVEVQAQMDNRIIKDKILDPALLKALWQAEYSSDYADKAVTGSLACMLTLMDGLSWQQADERARQLWEARNKAWPFGADAKTENVVFDTQGKHYAH